MDQQLKATRILGLLWGLLQHTGEDVGPLDPEPGERKRSCPKILSGEHVAIEHVRTPLRPIMAAKTSQGNSRDTTEICTRKNSGPC